MKNGEQIKWNNLQKMWEYSNSKEKFFQYIQTEMDILLKEL